jgi:DnaK suppressor protein
VWVGAGEKASCFPRYTRTVDLEHFKRRLIQKEQELLADIQRLQTEAREPRENEVRDEMDEVTSSEARDTAFLESSLEFETLQQVRDALQRIADGTFGKCIDCGREIQPARLEAVPWTPYCLEDQQKHDAAQVP